MTQRQRFQKRSFDGIISVLGLFFIGWLILLIAFIAFVDNGISGFYKSQRVGKNGTFFLMWKIRSMRPVDGIITTVTTDKDPRISAFGRFLRKTKLDELPQLWNVLIGNMSLVGPRPDVPGFADKLTGEERIILSIRPGITGPASLHFKNEEELLAQQENPEQYNREVIWPKKVAINKEYIQRYSLWKDIRIIIKTIF